MPFSDDDALARRAIDALREAAPGLPAAGAPAIPRYEILEKLGEGASGIVYRARDRELGRAVAIKILRESLAAQAPVRERFLREARVAARIVHPNVILLHDAGEVDGRPYLVIELVEGPSLAGALRGGIDLRAGVALIAQVSRGLAAAHAAGVVHRDVKPGNILVTKEGVPKLGDFGLAYVQGQAAGLTRTGAQMGTPLYMAPEQVRGRNADVSPRTDVHALGAILYETAAGHPPYPGETVTETFDRILRGEPAWLPPAVPRDLGTICFKALEKDPSRRYANAGELADDLERFLDGRSVEARPPGLFERALRRVARRPALSIGLTSALLAAGVAALSFIQIRDQRRRAEEVERRGRAPKEAAALLEQAESMLESDPGAARNLIERALQLHETGAGRFMRGRLAELEGDLRAAEAEWRRTLALDPALLEARYRLGRDLAISAATRGLLEGLLAGSPARVEFGEAGREFAAGNIEMVRPLGKTERIFVGLVIALSSGNPDGFWSQYKEAVRRYGSVKGMADLHWAAALVSPVAESDPHVRSAIEADPRHWPSLLLRAASRGSVEDASAACRLAPRCPEAQALSGWIRFRQGDRSAIRDFAIALDLGGADWPLRERVLALKSEAEKKEW